MRNVIIEWHAIAYYHAGSHHHTPKVKIKNLVLLRLIP